MTKIKSFFSRYSRTVLPICVAVLLLFSAAVPAQAAEADDEVKLYGKWEFYYNPPRDEEPPDVIYTINFSGDFSLGGTVLSYPDMEYSSVKRYFHFDNWTVKLASTGASVKIGTVLDFMDSPATCSKADFVAFCTMFRQLPVTGEDMVNDVFSIFSGIGGWIAGSIAGVMPMFYTEAEGLTFVGTLAVAALAVAVVLILISFVRRFFQFRG